MQYRIFSNVILSYLAVVITSLISFFSVPISVHYFGNEQFGLFSLTADIIAYLSLLNFGIPWAVSVIFAQINKPPIQRQLIIKSLVILIVLGISGLLIILLVNHFYANWLLHLIKMPKQLADLAKQFVLISVIFFLFRLPSSIFNQLLIFIHRVYLAKLVDISTSLLNLVTLLIVVHYNYNLVNYAVISGLGSLIISLLSVYLFITSWIGQTRKESITDVADVDQVIDISYRKIISSGYYYFVNAIGGLIMWNSSSLVIGHFLDLSSVAKYSILFKIFNILFMAITQIMNIVNPLLAQFYRDKEYNKLNKVFLFTTTVFPVVGGGIFILLFGLTKEIIVLWIHKQDLYAGTGTVFFVACYCYFLCSTIIPYFTLISLNMSRHLYKYTLYEALLNIILAVVMVRYFGIGGVALATLLAHIFTIFIFVPNCLSRLTDNLLNFDYIYVYKNFALIGVCALVICLLNVYLPVAMLTKILAMIILGILYLLASLVVMNNSQRQLLYNIITKKINLRD
jgi:O-antigen/teichoic acid export membrane protein